MRAGRLIGIAAAVLMVAAVAAILTVPRVQAVTQDKQAAKKAEEPKPNIAIRQREGASIQLPPGGGPRLGVQIRELEKDELARLKLASPHGVAVVDVTKDSAAERAGVRANDVILQFDGENVRSTQQLTRLVRETAPGRTVKMAVMRDGKRIEVEVTPAAAPSPGDVLINRDEIRRDVERELQALRDQLREFRYERRVPAPGPPPAPLPPGDAQRYRQFVVPPGTEDTFRWFGEEFPRSLDRWLSPGRGRLGVTVQELTPDLAAYFGVSDGVLISSVDADRPAAKAGLKAGDVITAVDGKAVKSSGDLVEQLAGKQGDVTIAVTRDKKALTLKAALDPPRPRPGRVIVAGRPV
jgi:serine protease Do